MSVPSILPPEPQYFTITDAARYLGISRTSMYSWLDQGLVPIYTGPTGVRRIYRADLDALFAKEN